MPENGAPDAIQMRLLQWLDAFPCQRLEDLVLALSPWHGRTSIYTALTTLQRAGLVESLDTRFCTGTRLYHLAPAGALWCWSHLRPHPALEGTTERLQTARDVVAAERQRLLRLFPRLPVLLSIQTVVNGLVSGAAAALTRQGRRASLVRWTWQRDAIHYFDVQGKTIRWFVDGVGAFRLRFDAGSGHVREDWYRFLLLQVPLIHPPLMRARLDRLLRWREAEERWEVYSQMPPILVLATSTRQAEWWHEATERVTQQLAVKRPLGAVTVLPKRGTVVSPWQFVWRQLGTEQICHLQDVLHPQDDPAFPLLFPADTRLEAPDQTKETARDLLSPPRIRRSFFSAQTRKQRPCPLPRRAWRGLALHWNARQWEMLALVQAHPLLARADLAASLQLVESSVRHLLIPLVQAGVMCAYETPVGERFALSEPGLRLVAASARCHVRYLVHRAGGQGTDLLVPRGLPGLLRQAAHIAGVYGFCSLLSRAGVLRWWETGTVCVRVYASEGAWHGIRPDLIAEGVMISETRAQREPRAATRFLLEWDRGTMQQRDLRRKFASYALWYASREWAREHRVPPVLLVVVPDIGQEQRVTRIALNAFEGCPTSVRLWTTTQGLLATAGVTAPIWRPVLPRASPQTHAEQHSSPMARQALFAAAMITGEQQAF